MNRRNIIIVVSILSFVFIIGGISYSYFVYNKDIGNVNLNTGEISINLSGINGNKTLTNVIPMGDNEGKTSSDYFDFTVDATVDTERIYYEVYLMPDDNNTLDINYLKTYLTDQNNVEIKGVTIFDDLGNSEVENGKVIYKGIIEVNQNGESKTETKDFRLRLWLDENYPEQTSKTFEFDIYLYAKNVDSDFILPYGANLLRKAIQEKESQGGACSTITWTDSEDNVTYLSGSKDCIDMNYVWYSGKLWRITAIYPDGAMKLVTENSITSTFWGSSTEYNGSWIYQWLNEDFYDTLVNADSIISNNSIWNYSTDDNAVPVRPDSLILQKTLSSTVGLLNSYEYYNAYRNSSGSTCFLNNKHSWWLLTPYSSSNVRQVTSEGSFGNYSASNITGGYRPSVVLKTNVELIGVGTKTNPYKIIGDKLLSENGETLISNRISGEYVKFDGELYRIVNTNNGYTKLTKVDYLRDNNTIITKNFASSVYFGKSDNTKTNDYWDYYLNNTWYNSISSTYRNMLVDDVYYLGLNASVMNYKATICKDVNLDIVTTNECNKYTTSDINKTFVGKVGLPRIGEMFSAQLDLGNQAIWFITPASTTAVRFIYGHGGVHSIAPTSSTYAVRPSITLKSGIKITGGTGYVGGDTNSPFEISE